MALPTPPMPPAAPTQHAAPPPPPASVAAAAPPAPMTPPAPMAPPAAAAAPPPVPQAASGEHDAPPFEIEPPFTNYAPAPVLPSAESWNPPQAAPSAPPPAHSMPAQYQAPLAPAPAAAQGGQMAAATGGGSLKESLAQFGIEGLDFDGFGVLSVIALNEGVFQSSDGTTNLGTSFNFYWNSSRAKYLVKTALPQTDPRSEFTYTYDMVTDARGRPVADVIGRWKQMGVTHEVKTYTEVAALLEDGTMVLLSIPSSSIRPISGTLANVVARGMDPTKTLLRASVGPKVTPRSQGSKPFTPWSITIAN